MKKKYYIYILLFGLLSPLCPTVAQNISSGVTNPGEKTKKAWEFGIGASALTFSRVDFTNFAKATDKYNLDLQLRHNVFGPNLYIARELNPHFYLDLQGTVGFTEQYENGKDKLKTLYMVGPGLQWRLGEYFGSQYIDPFLRVGVNYMHKNFDMKYTGVEGDLPNEMQWALANLYNKEGADRDNLIPVAFGLGMNAWLNDKFGIGLQGDYLLMPHKNVANSIQGTVRVIWRVGGKSKKKAPEIQYVEVEKIVQAPPIIQEKIVKVTEPAAPAPTASSVMLEICDLFNNIYFEFDKSDIKPESQPVLDKIADILKSNDSKKYLITGYTDARGSAEYNISLSRRRAASVVSALEERGVSPDMIKSRGVGKNISYAPVAQSNIVREGDRKVTVEIINNMDYWNFMPKKDY